MVLKSERSITFLDAMQQITSSKLHIEAAREQDSIGWINFLFGRLPKKWRELQRRHLNHYYPSKN